MAGEVGSGQARTVGSGLGVVAGVIGSHGNLQAGRSKAWYQAGGGRKGAGTEGKYCVPPAPQARRVWGDPLTLHIAWAGHWQDPWGGRAAGQQGCVTQSHPVARAGSGPLPRNPQNLVLRVSGPKG